MIKNWFWAVLISPVTLLAQEKGIAFEHTLSWNDLLQKAKVEHKYIFVDCYASWCGPCKVMDRNVYPNDSLGEWMNRQFISIKVQLDSTSHDNPEVQKWYPVAHRLERDYRINAYPSFLFFSPDGQAVDKEIGGRDVKAFMEMARAAIDPVQQFYTLLTQYQSGDKTYPLLPKLVGMAQRIGEDSLAKALARDYLNRYLLSLPTAQRWTKDNLDFLNDYGSTVKSDDKLFKLYFKDRKMINQMMNDTAYADRLINRVVYADIVKHPLQQGIKTNVEPAWPKLAKNIKSRFGPAYVDRNIVPGKVEYYRSTKQWALYAKYFVLRMKQIKIETWTAGGRTSLIMNNDAFEVFKYSKDKEELEAALSWIDRVLSMEAEPGANELDTKANILYKLGRTGEGLRFEAQSASLAPKDKEIQDDYDKMKNGLPTWPTQY